MKQMSVVAGGVLAMVAGFAVACPEGTACDGTACQGMACDQQAVPTVIEMPGGAVLDLTGSFESPLTWTTGAGVQRGFLMHTDDDESVQVVINGEDVKVIRNGKPVPSDQVKRDGDKLYVLDADGNVLTELNVSVQGGPQWEQAYQVYGQAAERPPVMVGITMGEPDDALRTHLGLGERRVIMLDNVMPGLPAAEAGLKKYDIIVAIDGSDDDVTASKLQEVLKKKQPGDELKLRVLRGGQKETYTVTLRAYDEQKMAGAGGESGMALELFPKLSPAAPSAPKAPVAPAMPEKDIEQMLKKLKDSGVSDEQLRELKQALRKADEASRQQRLEIMRDPGGGSMIIQGPDGQRRLIEIPQDFRNVPGLREFSGEIQRLAPQGEEMEQRLEALEKRMNEMSEQMEQKLDRVLRRFEELTDRLERRLRDEG